MSGAGKLTDGVLVGVCGRAGRLTLNRPEALHALDLAMCQTMLGALLSWRSSPDIDHVVIDHLPGTRGFCAGGDIRMLAESGAAAGAGRGREARSFFRTEYQLNHVLFTYPKPVFAVMDGVTMGGGVGISVHGRYRIATPATLFAMPETGIGLFPDVGASWFLPRLPGMLGMYLALTGGRLKGRAVLEAGIATHFAGTALVPGLADRIAEEGERALATLEHAPAEPDTEQLVGLAADRLAHLFDRARVEDIFASLSAQTGDWAREQLDALRKKSPQTLKVAHRQMRLGRDLTDFAAAMQMEYRIASRVVERPDFIEGVRALIIDKDNAPRWLHDSVEAVPDALIDAIFAPLPANEEWQPASGHA